MFISEQTAQREKSHCKADHPVV